MFKINVGKKDRLIRIILGFVLMVVGLFVFKDFKIFLLIFGGLFLLTGVFRFCGLYSLFGINTCER